MNTYRNLKIGEIIKEGDEMAEKSYSGIVWCAVWSLYIGTPRTKGIIIRRRTLDVLKRIYREICAEKVIRQHPHTNTTAVMPHAFPQRTVRNIGEATGRMDFDRAERDYHGYEKPLEIATGGHRLRGLDFLIKSRS